MANGDPRCPNCGRYLAHLPPNHFCVPPVIAVVSTPDGSGDSWMRRAYFGKDEPDRPVRFFPDFDPEQHVDRLSPFEAVDWGEPVRRDALRRAEKAMLRTWPFASLKVPADDELCKALDAYRYRPGEYSNPLKENSMAELHDDAMEKRAAQVFNDLPLPTRHARARNILGKALEVSGREMDTPTSIETLLRAIAEAWQAELAEEDAAELETLRQMQAATPPRSRLETMVRNMVFNLEQRANRMVEREPMMSVADVVRSLRDALGFEEGERP